MKKIWRAFLCQMGYHSFHWKPQGILQIPLYTCRYCPYYEASVSRFRDYK